MLDYGEVIHVFLQDVMDRIKTMSAKGKFPNYFYRTQLNTNFIEISSKSIKV